MNNAPASPTPNPAQITAPLHIPVLYQPCLDQLNIQPNGIYLDGTFGRGGHAQGILQQLNADGRLLVMDKDPEAIAVAQQKWGNEPRVSIFQGSFAQLASWQAPQSLDGILLDLGVSSPQLDQAERGFSFSKDGPLDMRMASDQGKSAAEWLASATEAEISDVLWRYGEERMSRRIAKTILQRRAVSPITRTAELANLIASVVGRGKHDHHPATRSFQAIRIFINQELKDLEIGLAAALQCLKPQGRLAVISFHSLEDRIVKQFIQRYSKPPATNRRLPELAPFIPLLNALSGAIRADETELSHNPRARSAVLRIAERTEHPLLTAP